MDGQGQTDVAALAAGVVAVSVSLLVTPGPYDIIGAIVAVSLGLVVVGYVWPHPRSRMQSYALGAVCGVIVVPVAGFALESWLAVVVSDQQSGSRVASWWLALLWLATLLAVASLDQQRWKPRR